MPLNPPPPSKLPDWPVAPSSGGLIIFSPRDRNYLVANQSQQDTALSNIYALLQLLIARSDVIQTEVTTLATVLEDLLATFSRPVSGHIQVNVRI